MEFELSLQMTSETQPGVGSSTFSRLKFLPANQASQTNQHSSLIKGVLVAAPVNGGLPGVTISMHAEKLTGRKATISVSVSGDSNVELQGKSIEINIDHDLSQELNSVEGRNAPLKPKTALGSSSLSLDANGHASTILTISTQEPGNQLIAVIVDAFGQSETLLYRLE